MAHAFSDVGLTGLLAREITGPMIRIGWLWLVLVAAGCSDDPTEVEVSGGAEPVTTAAPPETPVGEGELPEAREEPVGPPQKIFAKRFVVPVRTGPSRGAERIGYLRAGAVVLARNHEPIPDEPERRRCRRGWFELTTGGFVCNVRDVIPFDGEDLPAIRATQPTRDTPLPYRYGFIRNRVPQFKRIPTPADFAELEERRAEIAAAAAAESEGESDAEAEGEGEVEAPVARVDPEPAEGETGTNLETDEDGDDEDDETLETLQGEEGTVIARYLMRGFFVSLDREFERNGRRYWRTQANGFVPHRAVLERTGSEYEGVPLTMLEAAATPGSDSDPGSAPAPAPAPAPGSDPEGEGDADAGSVAVVAPRLPYAWTLSSQTRAYRRTERGAFRVARGPVEYHEGFSVLAEVEHEGRTYLQAGPDRWFRDRDLRVARQRDRRPRHRRMGEVGPTDKWLDVNLAEQTLVAYEGDTPVYATLISSGKKHPEEDWETITGLFRIKSKHLTDTMDGDTAVDGPYSVDDVPYVMYIELAYALHSAFWHNGFGRPRSHGCVNLSPLDARWVFNWSDPPLPDNWHSVYPDEETPGTWVFIHGETPVR